MKNYHKLLIFLMAFLFMGNLSVSAQEEYMNKNTLFKWAWETTGNDHIDKMRSNSTFKYYYPFDTHPTLSSLESSLFRKGPGGKSNVELQFHGNKAVLVVDYQIQYNKLRLPVYPAYQNKEDRYWNVFRIDMSLDNGIQAYNIPLQLRLFMDNKTKNKVEISLKNDGSIVFAAENSNNEKKVVFDAGKKIDITKRFLLEYRLSNQGDFVVLVDKKEHFKKKIPANFILDGVTNGVWFEGQTTIHSINQEQWHKGSNFGVSDFEINLHTRYITSNFKKIADLFDGHQFKLSSSSQMNFKKGSFKKDTDLTKSSLTFSIRSNFYKDKNDNVKINYKVGVYVYGSVETNNNKRENITFPIVYEFDFPKEGHDYSDRTVDPNYEFKIYTTDIENPFIIEKEELRK